MSLSKLRNLMTVLSDSTLAVVVIIKTNLYSEQSPRAPNPSVQVHPSLPLCDHGPPCSKALSLERTICFAELTLTLPQWVPPSTPSHHHPHLKRSLSLSWLAQVPLPLWKSPEFLGRLREVTLVHWQWLSLFRYWVTCPKSLNGGLL